MKNLLDIENWPRKEHFYFFSQFDEPFFGVTVEIDCTEAYKKAKATGASFFLYYLHKSLLAANQIESFRYRIEGKEVIIHDSIDASATINRPDNTFGFSYIPFNEDFDEFVIGAKEEIANVQASKTLLPSKSGDNVIHYSSLPWLKFTSLSHARHFAHKDSVPKISFGKLFDKDGRKYMACSIHVHHALLDGFDVGKHVDLFQELMNN
ncbi:MAG: chloramphenicol acetyltransferase [Thalassobius sp.]|nr:chloramphenicol acetyltransferase [Thalassovita sp.]|tara:strand:+ start:94 stop:717 length:624 start_codon:yes stop_codon:yes gene_type:complete